MQVMSLSRCLIWTAAAVLAVSCQAQVVQPAGTMPGRRLPFPPRQGVSNPPAATPQPANPAAVPQTTTPVQPSIHTGATATAPDAHATQSNAAPSLPPSLLDKPAGAAQVTLHDGSLSVDAHNSSLSEILRKLEATSGMTVDGFDKDSRIFGVYGPGSPRDVLSALLDGAGYNFAMVGSTPDGAPREIVLTTRSNAPLSSPSSGNNSQQDEEEETPNYPPPEQAPPPPQQPPMMPSAEQRPRTPQEMLQELQRLRQQQQQQQPNQPQQ
jgi:hypothetical protein